MTKDSIHSAWRRLLGSFSGTNKSGWIGSYSNWQEALAQSEGYNSQKILEKVRAATFQIENGDAVYERDGVCFDHIEYSWPLLSCLLFVAANKGGKLRVLDFGGSLGSTYRQNRRFLADLSVLTWNVVEQDQFVQCGRESFQSEELRFFSSIEECMESGSVDVVLFSGVLQYLEEPYSLLQSVLELGVDYLLFDRTIFTPDDSCRLAVQRVDPRIYEASYPCWIFSLSEFLKEFDGRYRLKEEFLSQFDGFNIGFSPLKSMGFFFEKMPS